MAPFTYTIDIEREPQEVFAFATDPRRFSEWQRDVVRVRMLDGARFESSRRFAGSERTTVQRITRNDPPHHWAAEGIDGPVRPYATITVEPVDDGTRSRVIFTLDFEGHGIGVPLLPLIRRQAQQGAQQSYHHLKRLLEARDSPGHSGTEG